MLFAFFCNIFDNNSNDLDSPGGGGGEESAQKSNPQTVSPIFWCQKVRKFRSKGVIVEPEIDNKSNFVFKGVSGNDSGSPRAASEAKQLYFHLRVVQNDTPLGLKTRAWAPKSVLRAKKNTIQFQVWLFISFCNLSRWQFLCNFGIFLVHFLGLKWALMFAVSFSLILNSFALPLWCHSSKAL